ncbi:hypothetical protein B0T21DRAFT_403456 [Apiosordaria backusii]|uniref:NAD(P)-binding protein n=1 Tax=Apiosordaria backusii TaxID=314023 RepID=A0AA40B2J8_9PEZI|nr:hypothetical protein B0T21DRAFT_403456 [Apiosordaria backusii]
MVDHSKNTVYLITGANRGIGLALVSRLSTRPSTTVIATTRAFTTLSPFDSITPTHPALPSPPSSTTPNPTSPLPLYPPSVFDTSEEDYRNDFEVNTLGPIRLFKAVWGFLEEGGRGKGGKFVVVGSSVGSIGGLATPEGEVEGGMLVCGSYGVSKAGVQWWVVKLRAELKVRYAQQGGGEEGEGKGQVVVGVVHPGWVKTDMGQGLADAVGFEAGPPLSVDESAQGVIEQIDKLTMENSGQFWRWDGGVLPW